MTTTAVEVQRRYLTIDEPKADSDQLEFSFSSETPVTRYFGDEVLDHDRAAVDLSRLNGGAAPLLLNHDPDRVLGIVERAWIDEKRRGMAHHLGHQRPGPAGPAGRLSRSDAKHQRWVRRAASRAGGRRDGRPQMAADRAERREHPCRRIHRCEPISTNYDPTTNDFDLRNDQRLEP